MSSWRKAVAIGAFSIGTFGLGFTVGGLVFGRWRRGELIRRLIGKLARRPVGTDAPG